MSKTEKKKLTLKRLRELLEYHQISGKFYWLTKSSKYSKIQIGYKAGCLVKGYIQITIDGTQYKAHRLAWLYCNNVWPSGHIDHIDGNPSNNRIENLRDVTVYTNMRNKRKYRRADNSLPTGVSVGNRDKFQCVIGYKAHWIGVNGKLHQVYFKIKDYNSPQECIDAAMRHREHCISKLILSGVDYTKRHGLFYA